jgi:osmotically-inducible protein OsmY
MKAKLFDDNNLRGASISVDTFEGNVTLTGDKDMF